MPAAQTGLILSLKEAQTSLFDNKGNLLEFKEQEDGTFKSAAVEGDGYNYTYELNPQPVIVTVLVTKEAVAAKKKAVVPRPATAKEEKEAENYNKSIGSRHK
jgi:hypothetical protein